MIVELTDEDEQSIHDLIESLPDVDKRIVSIVRYSNGEVHVWTGELRGPRVGAGDSISVKKIDGRWRVKHIGSWFS